VLRVLRAIREVEVLDPPALQVLPVPLDPLALPVLLDHLVRRVLPDLPQGLRVEVEVLKGLGVQPGLKALPVPKVLLVLPELPGLPGQLVLKDLKVLPAPAVRLPASVL